MSYRIKAQSRTGVAILEHRATAQEALERARELKADDKDVTIEDVKTEVPYSLDQFAALQEKQ